MNLRLQWGFRPSLLPSLWEWLREGVHCASEREGGSLSQLTREVAELFLQGGWAWTILQGERPVGAILCEAIYLRGTLADTSVHIAVAREAWGLGAEELARECMAWGFKVRGLQRISARIPRPCALARRAALHLDFKPEGTLPGAIQLHGEPGNLDLFGITRAAWLQETTL